MAVSNEQKMETYLADAAITKGWAVKIGTDSSHVARCSATTDKSIGICQSTVTTAEDAVEVAAPGGGAKGLLGGTVSAGMLLTPTTTGALIKVSAAGDRVVAVAKQDGVSGDLINVDVLANQAYQTES